MIIKIKELLKLLEKSEIYKKFKQENPDSFFCAGFFTIDPDREKQELSLDFKAGDQIASFSLTNGEFDFKQEEVLDKTKPINEIKKEVRIEISDIEEIIKKELKKRSIVNEIEKLIIVLQENQGKIIYNTTCLLKGLKILLVHIDSQKGEILKFENKSLFDVVRPVK